MHYSQTPPLPFRPYSKLLDPPLCAVQCIAGQTAAQLVVIGQTYLSALYSV